MACHSISVAVTSCWFTATKHGLTEQASHSLEKTWFSPIFVAFINDSHLGSSKKHFSSLTFAFWTADEKNFRMSMKLTLKNCCQPILLWTIFFAMATKNPKAPNSPLLKQLMGWSGSQKALNDSRATRVRTHAAMKCQFLEKNSEQLFSFYCFSCRVESNIVE